MSYVSESVGSDHMGCTGVYHVVHGMHVRPVSMGSGIQLLEKTKYMTWASNPGPSPKFEPLSPNLELFYPETP